MKKLINPSLIVILFVIYIVSTLPFTLTEQKRQIIAALYTNNHTMFWDTWVIAGALLSISSTFVLDYVINKQNSINK